jgi:hypothetical protein
MERIVRHTPLLIGALTGCGMAAATLGVERLYPEWVVFLLIPGFFLSIAVSGNVHAFPLSLAALGNFLFWLVLCWLVAALITKLLRRRIPSDHPESSTAVD